jgi:hypothetical protein
MLLINTSRATTYPSTTAAYSIALTSSIYAHRDRKGFDMDAILSAHEDRTAENDFRISFEGKHYQMEASRYQEKIWKEIISLEERLAGTLRVRFYNLYFIIHRE